MPVGSRRVSRRIEGEVYLLDCRAGEDISER